MTEGKKIALVLIVSLGLGLLFDYFFYGNKLGISFPLYTVLVAGIYFIFNYLFAKKLTARIIALFFCVFLFSAFVAVRDNGFLIFLDVMAILGLSLLVVKESVGINLRNYSLADYIFTTLSAPFFLLGRAIMFLADAINHKPVVKETIARKVIVGLVMAIPVIIVFVLLFSSADLVFQRYVDDLINFKISPELPIHVFLIVIVTLLLTGTWAVIYFGKQVPELNKSSSLKIGNAVIVTFLSAINLLFLLFVFIQIGYLFGGEKNITEAGFTYAEYARKGFGELVWVAFLSFLIILGSEHLITKKDSGKHFGSYTFSSLALTILVLVITISAFKRLVLYVDAYGLTIDRFLSSSFVVWLVVLFLLMGYKIIRSKSAAFLGSAVLVSLILFVVALNLANPDALIANVNIDRYRNTGKLDLNYLTILSADAVPAMVKFTQEGTEDERKLVSKDLYNRKATMDADIKWQSFNFSRDIAIEKINSSLKYFEQFKDFQAKDPSIFD